MQIYSVCKFILQYFDIIFRSSTECFKSELERGKERALRVILIYLHCTAYANTCTFVHMSPWNLICKQALTVALIDVYSL